MKTSKLSNLSGFLRKSPGANELGDVLEFLPQASLLCDSEFESISFSNKQARELLVYSNLELNNLKLLSLIPDLNLIVQAVNSQKFEIKVIKLIQHSGMPINVSLKITLIGSQNQWALLRFKPIKDVTKSSGDTKNNWTDIQLLSKIASNPENKGSIRQILQAGSNLTGAKLLGLYLLDETTNNLVLANGWGDVNTLPKNITEKEVQHLQKPIIWDPDNKQSDSSQKFSISIKAKYIATIPLNADNPQEGLLLISDQSEAPPNDLIDRMKLIIISYNSCKKNSIKITNGNTDEIDILEISIIGRSIENAISDGLLLVSEKLKILSLNSSAEFSLGYQSTEAEGEHLKDILIGIDSIIKNIENIASSKSEIHDFGRLRIRRRDSQSILLNIRAIPVYHKNANLLAILISDLSKQEEIESELLRLKDQALLGEVTATFAHEIRNPINNISTSLQLMDMTFPENAKIQKQIKRMEVDCDRLTILINSILTYAKIREYKLFPLDFIVFIKSIMDQWQNNFRKNNIESRLMISKNIPKINAEKNSLDQVFTNLISNAVRAMQDQSDGLLVIKVEPIEENGIVKNISIDISDNGPGIPQEIQNRIFKPFYTTNSDGTGIGLAVTKRIISSHNGEISLTSFPGGTIFNIKIPVI